MRGVLIYVRFDLKHIQGTLSNIKNDLGNVVACSQGGDEPKKLFMILIGKRFSNG
jgi:hypothetical protein